MALNKVFLIGNAGKDPDIRYTDKGATVAQFTLATGEKFKDRNGDQKEQTEWHNIVCWHKLAEFVGQYVKKGSKIFVEGKIRSRSYDDQNGQKKYITEVVAINLQLLDKKAGAPLPPEPDDSPDYYRTSVTEAAARVAAKQRHEPENDTDDLPF